MQVETYLFFDGRCEEAIEFYRGAIGAELKYLMRFKDSPVPLPPGMVPPGGENRIFHATLRIGETMIAMADGNDPPDSRFQRFALVLKVPDNESAERMFAALADGGEIKLPLHEAFFASRYGIVIDRFGITWKLQVVK